MKVRFAISAGARPPEAELLRSFVTEAERFGFDTLWFSDLGVLPSTDPLLSVAMAAAWTSRVKLGMTIVPFGYEPFVFARQIAQLDRLSGGRLRLMLVPGLGGPGEASALGIEAMNRGRLLDGLIPKLRTLWSGLPLAEGGSDKDVPALPSPPLQQPLQIWLAGSGSKALDRAGRLADGWRGGGTSVERAGEIREEILAAATAAGRTFDPEHFGLTIAYARDGEDLQRTGPIHEDPAALGRDALRDLIAELVDVGLSKFSLRRITPVQSWEDELAWLADAVLDLQT